MKGAATGAVVVSGCAAPIAALNVWPRLSQMWDQGAASGNDVGIVLLVVVAALLMAAVPFAMEKAGNWGFWLACLTFGAGLACLNYSLAVGAIGKVRDLTAGQARELVHKAAGLNSRIERARNSRKALPQFTWTTAEGVAAAKRAADAAATSRADECRDRGNYCRKREADEMRALEALGAATAARAQTEQAEHLDGELRAAEQELAALGPIPDNVDPHAARLAKVVGRVADLGDNPIETVADALISALSVFAELIGLLGPRIIMTAIGHQDAPAPRQRARWRWRKAPPASVLAPDAVVSETPATPATEKKPRKNRTPTVRESGSVREWKNSRTAPRPGSRIKPADAYQAYKGWCVEQGCTPISLTAFGLAMKGELKVRFEERSKRGWYLDLALVGSPRLAVVAAS